MKKLRIKYKNEKQFIKDQRVKTQNQRYPINQLNKWK